MVQFSENISLKSYENLHENPIETLRERSNYLKFDICNECVLPLL